MTLKNLFSITNRSGMDFICLNNDRFRNRGTIFAIRNKAVL